jgi:hypothetical protein
VRQTVCRTCKRTSKTHCVIDPLLANLSDPAHRPVCRPSFVFVTRCDEVATWSREALVFFFLLILLILRALFKFIANFPILIFCQPRKAVLNITFPLVLLLVD